MFLKLLWRKNPEKLSQNVGFGKFVTSQNRMPMNCETIFLFRNTAYFQPVNKRGKLLSLTLNNHYVKEESMNCL